MGSEQKKGIRIKKTIDGDAAIRFQTGQFDGKIGRMRGGSVTNADSGSKHELSGDSFQFNNRTDDHKPGAHIRKTMPWIFEESKRERFLGSIRNLRRARRAEIRHGDSRQYDGRRALVGEAAAW